MKSAPQVRGRGTRTSTVDMKHELWHATDPDYGHGRIRMVVVIRGVAEIGGSVCSGLAAISAASIGDMQRFAQLLDQVPALTLIQFREVFQSPANRRQRVDVFETEQGP